MIKFFKNLFNNKNVINASPLKDEFDIHSTSLVLAYEVARSDGEIDINEIEYLKSLIDDSECKDDILNQLEEFSENSTSFYNLIKDINDNCSLDQKEGIIRLLWDVAYSDEFLEVHEERIIRRIADLIMIKDIRVLRLKDDSKNLK
ncbi:MAG: hypothetical protein NT02SARS_0707, partial [SAR86 cluster bacterium SAR86B]